MAKSSILGGEHAPARGPGHDVDALGPSDSSDSGSDVQGERPMATGADTPDELGSVTVRRGTDSDADGTGERASAAGDDALDGADILPDRIGRDPTMQSDDALSAGELAEVDVEDLMADEDAGLEDDIDELEDDDLTDIDHAEAVRLGDTRTGRT